MEQGNVKLDVGVMSDCMQSAQDQTENYCCQEEQCNKHCKTLHCSNTGKLSALTIDGNIETGYFSLSQNHIRLMDQPGNGISNTPLRPPKAHL